MLRYKNSCSGSCMIHMADVNQPGKQRGRHGGHQTTRIALTEEEKAVLLECRRNSIARGLPLGVLTVLLLRRYIKRAHPPNHMARWSWFYYAGGFMMSFVLGVSSYRHQCFEKIMALDNSVLADQVRAHTHQRRNDHWKEQQPTPGTPMYHPSPRKQPDSILDDQPAMQHSELPGVPESSDSLPSSVPHTDQPHMFQSHPGSEGERSPMKKRGRTFDDIREENRRQQMQQAYPKHAQWMERQQQQREEENERNRTGTEQRPQGTGRIPRRNKYGDIVYDD